MYTCFVKKKERIKKFFDKEKRRLVRAELGISLLFFFLFISIKVRYAFLNIANGTSSDVIDFDGVLRSRETKVDTYVAGRGRPLIRLFLRSSVSFLISVRSWRFYCLIVPRPANVSSNRIDSRRFHRHLSYQYSCLNQNLFEQTCSDSTYVLKIKISIKRLY